MTVVVFKGTDILSVDRVRWVRMLKGMTDEDLSKVRDRLANSWHLTDRRIEAIAYMMLEYKRRGYGPTEMLQPIEGYFFNTRRKKRRRD
tara:strand:- start:370 stop:636 length:267 start_codon:yes stop_codon:yes gene_type:complete